MILEIILTIIIICLSVTLFYALRRINQYENILIDFQNIIKFASEKLKVVDTGKLQSVAKNSLVDRYQKLYSNMQSYV